jgi:thiol-disulfide isomerase/thioredoxin
VAEADTSRTDRKRAAVFLVIVSVALLLVALIRFSAGDEGGDAAVLPSVELTGAEETVVLTDDLVGGPLVINFWYAACPPCANELKDFAAVHEQYGDRVRFVGVNAIDTVDEMIEFAGKRGVSYELFQDQLAELQTDMRLTSFPTTLFVAADGTIIDRTGVLDESRLEAKVLALLALSGER